MTNWEKSCVDSLVTSPTAFALFKAKQKNKKHVDQYINTIWPYEIKKVFKESNPTHNITLEAVKKFLIDLKKQGETGYVDKDYMFGSEITASEIRNGLKNLPREQKSRTENGIGIIIFCSKEHQNHSVCIDPNTEINLIDTIYTGLSNVNQMCKFYKIVTDTRSTRRNTTNFINSSIKQLSKIGKTTDLSKFKRVYLGQNVGIEIEYEGIWQKYLEKKLNSSKYAMSFNSGIDGGETDGSRYGDASRLRENRLRINGHRGLNALHYLLEDMIRSKCSITNKSGMHYHIDLTHLSEKKRDIPAVDRFKKLCINTEIQKQLADIFEIKEDRVVLDTMYSLLRYPTEFTTIEWRMGTPTFNFTKLTIQILCAIHVTNVLFGSKKTMDAEYLKYLAEIYIKINS